ncbi:hypothetical protein [Aphanothece minutissima]|uniref:hypothetical protein n=1 Tax=Aphanothece minutissima TaxID=543815 RepID=UPI0011B1FA6D|nr:hypothetical protein [Aphanothece minutissima]
MGKARRNQLLSVGCLAGLLAGTTPAMAFTSFDVDFNADNKKTSSEATGVSAKMTFSFSKLDPANDADNRYTLDLNITNTSPVGLNPTGTLTAFAFNVPGPSSSPAFKLLTYNPLNSNFGDVYGASLNGNERNVSNNNTLTFPITGTPRRAAYAPFGSFTFCARDTGTSCHGGSSNGTGLTDGQSTDVRFTLASNSPTINSASLVAQSFFDLFNSRTFTNDGDFKNAQVALRFQNVTNSKGRSGKSDKVAGIPIKPPQGPVDEVPGPLPVFGAATAFAFSRRLRRRVATAELQTQPVA